MLRGPARALLPPAPAPAGPAPTALEDAVDKRDTHGQPAFAIQQLLVTPKQPSLAATTPAPTPVRHVCIAVGEWLLHIEPSGLEGPASCPLAHWSSTVAAGMAAVVVGMAMTGFGPGACKADADVACGSEVWWIVILTCVPGATWSSDGALAAFGAGLLGQPVAVEPTARPRPA